MKKVLIIVLIGLVCGGLVLGLYLRGVPFLELMELKARDAMFKARGPLSMRGSPVAVVAVGERSLDAVGRWPWPREKTARLLQAVLDQGVKSLGLDLGFFEPDNRVALQALLAMDKAAQAGKPLKLEQVLGRFHPDFVLAQVVAAHRERVVLGYFFHTERRQVEHLDEKEARRRVKAVAKFAYPVVRFTSPAAMEAPFPLGLAPENNVPILIKAARWGGYFNVLPDYDGVVRRIPLVIKCAQDYFPSLAVVTLSRFLGQPLPALKIYPYGLESVRLGPLTLPVDERGRFRINFRGGSAVLPVVEAVDVLTGQAPPGALQGKAVVISVTAAGVMDHRPTPLAAQMPGGYILAQAMDNMLAGDYLNKTNWTSLLDLAAIMALALCAALLLSLLHPVPGGLAALGLAGGYIWLVFELFKRGWLLSVVHPLLALGLAGAAGVVFRYLVLEKDKKYIRRAFQYYLSPSVIHELLKNPGRLELGGVKAELSVLFADVRGFTTISEKLEPDVLASVLNMFMDRMSQAVLDNEGVLDKYMGDAVMAFFGAPVEQPDHAARACRTGLAMMSQVEALEPEWERLGVPPLSLGVGANTGPMVVGNMGSSLRFDYTVIGDNVNIASRLEGQTKEYGVGMVVSQSTRDAAADWFHFRKLDLIRVKGKTRPVAIYEVVSENHSPAPEWVALAEEAFEAYLARDFRGALALYAQILARKPRDQASLILQARCQQYLREPPPDDWDGAETKQSK